MSTATPKRLVIDLPDEDHRALKGLAASAGVPMRSLILAALRNDLQARQRALSGQPAPIPAP
jgi:hypothetical protein